MAVQPQIVSERDSIDGYVAEDVYPSTFQREFAPPWIDAMLRHKGLVPPRQGRSAFRLLDLGCGDGLGLIAMAAAHPEGEFLGIDAMAEHIEDAQATSKRIGLTNIQFRCARFSEVAPPTRPRFDYVTGQGLLAWISEENRRHVYRIAAEQLRPGGIACLGYNAMPGWRDMIAFQQIVRQLAEGRAGSPFERFSAALAQVKAMVAAGAPSLPQWLMEWIDGQIGRIPGNYFAHEYLNQHWGPLWSSQVIGPMAGHGFTYLGPSRLDRLREDLCTTRAQRGELAKIGDPSARETAADLFARASFRVDLYGCDVAPIADPAQARLDGWWAARVAEADADYSWATAAGTLRFDNAAAHAILGGLAAGPRTLRSIHGQGGAGTIADILNTADALAISGQITPVDPPAIAPAAAPANAEFRARIAAGAGFDCQVGAHGAIPVAHRLLSSDDSLQILARLGISINA